MSSGIQQQHGRQSQGLSRQQYRVLDEAARNRRTRQQLEQLERDNFHEDPHANLVMHKKAPKFEDNAVKTSVSSSSGGSGSSAGGSLRSRHHKIRTYNFSTLLEEDSKSPEPNYHSATAPSPDNVTINGKIVLKLPRRHFCSVCGHVAPYTCLACGMRFCCINCLGSHRDTRCLKWTA